MIALAIMAVAAALVMPAGLKAVGAAERGAARLVAEDWMLDMRQLARESGRSQATDLRIPAVGGGFDIRLSEPMTFHETGGCSHVELFVYQGDRQIGRYLVDGRRCKIT